MKTLLKAYKIIKSKKRPILEYGLYKNGTLLMTDLEIAIEVECHIQNADNKLIHIPTLEKCEKLDMKNLRYEDGELIDTDSKISVKMQDENIEDFPSIEDSFSKKNKKSTITVSLNYKDVESISRSIACGESSRYSINAVAVYKNGTMASTDGRRLHIVGDVFDDDEPVMLPPSIIKISKLFKVEGELCINEKHDFAILHGDFGRVIFQTIRRKYPDIKSIIPKNTQPLKINAEELLKVLKKIKKAAASHEPMSFGLGRCLSWNGVEFPLKLPKGLSHCFNYNYVIDALEAVEPEFFELSKKNDIPVKVHKGQKMAIVTPIKIV